MGARHLAGEQLLAMVSTRDRAALASFGQA